MQSKHTIGRRHKYIKIPNPIIGASMNRCSVGLTINENLVLTTYFSSYFVDRQGVGQVLSRAIYVR
jgi:hypothetical protein